MLSGDPEAAMIDIQRLIEAEPNYVDAYWSLVSISVSATKYDETLKTLKTLKTKFSAEPTDLTKMVKYKDFVASPQYHEWRRWLENKQESPSPRR
jgi:NAD-dependent DNA ligase